MNLKFAERIFRWSGIYGILVLFPLYFLEGKIAEIFPPPGNHPEQFYGFVGVALAWQFAFLLVASDVRRYRPLMLPAIAEKFLGAGAAVLLFLQDRVPVLVAAPAVVDLLIGAMFILAYWRTRELRATD